MTEKKKGKLKEANYNFYTKSRNEKENVRLSLNRIMLVFKQLNCKLYINLMF